MKNKGFSLIELMVAMVVGMIATAAIYSFLISSLKIYSSQQDVSQIQFNAQGVLRFLNDTFKNAGSGAVARIPVKPFEFINNASTVDADNYLTGTDAIQIRKYGNVGSIMNIKSYSGTDHYVTLDSRTSYVDDYNPNYPTYDSSNPPNLLAPPAAPSESDNISIGSSLLMWKDGVDDYSMVKVSNAFPYWGSGIEQDAVIFSTDPSLNLYNTATGSTEDYSRGYAILVDKNSLTTTTFFVDTNNVLRMVNGYYDINNPANPLNQKALPLMDNVEDFQIQLGFDNSGTEKRDVDTWEFNPTIGLDKAIAIKCFVLLKGDREDKNIKDIKRIDIDPDDNVTYADPKDNLRRRLYSFTVQLRNRLSI